MADIFSTLPPPTGSEPAPEGSTPPAPEPQGTETPEAPPAGEPSAPPAGEVEGAPAPPPYLEVDQYGDHLVKIKVSGNEVELPFREAINGVMMGRDYTQKTQELAEERRRLQQADLLVAALEQNPQQTLRELAEVYDFDPDNALAPVERSEEQRQLRELQQQVQQQQEQYARQMMQNEIAAIKQQDPNADPYALAAFARENGTTLTVAHQVLQAQKVLADQQEAQAAEQRRQAALAASQVHDQSNTQRGSVAPGSGKAPTSLREAWALSKQQLGQ
jgi:hypothetical protein